jgi:hypothetical protein
MTPPPGQIELFENGWTVSLMITLPTDGIHFKVCPLRLSQIDQAFAMLDLTGPSMSLAAWRHYAEPRLRADPSTAGILSVQCERAYIYGLLGYETVRLGGEQTMAVDLFEAIDPISDGAITRPLIAAVESMATRSGCSAVHFDLPNFMGAQIIVLRPNSLAVLCQSGYGVEAIAVSKSLIH